MPVSDVSTGKEENKKRAHFVTTSFQESYSLLMSILTCLFSFQNTFYVLFEYETETVSLDPVSNVQYYAQRGDRKYINTLIISWKNSGIFIPMMLIGECSTGFCEVPAIFQSQRSDSTIGTQMLSARKICHKNTNSNLCRLGLVNFSERAESMCFYVCFFVFGVLAIPPTCSNRTLLWTLKYEFCIFLATKYYYSFNLHPQFKR